MPLYRDVFGWGDDEIIKLFRADLAPEAVNRERLVADALSELPVAAPRNLARIRADVPAREADLTATERRLAVRRILSALERTAPMSNSTDVDCYRFFPEAGRTDHRAGWRFHRHGQSCVLDGGRFHSDHHDSGWLNRGRGYQADRRDDAVDRLRCRLQWWWSVTRGNSRARQYSASRWEEGGAALIGAQKSKRSNRSLIAGLLVGAYLLAAVLYVGFGRLSRLRAEMVGRCQLCSMNFRIETWSA